MAQRTVTRSIGTSSRDYSTTVLWEADKLADLTDVGTATAWAISTAYVLGDFVANDTPVNAYVCVTAGTSAGSGGPTGTGTGIADNTCSWDFVGDTGDTLIWKGEAYNDAEFTDALTIGGSTVSATGYTHLTTAAGQGFRDHVNAATNAYDYNQSNGVGNVVADRAFLINDDYTIVQNFQSHCNYNAGYVDRRPVNVGSSLSNVRLVDCIFKSTLKADNPTLRSGQAETCLFVCAQTSNIGGLALQSGGKATSCAVVRPDDLTAGGTGFETNYSNNIVINCVTFGFTNDYSASGWDTTNSKNNAAADTAANIPGGSSQGSLTYADEFENVNAATADYRLKSGSTLEGNAVVAFSTDAIGTTRDVSTPDIGPWEFVAAVGGANPKGPLGHPFHGPFGGPI